MKTYILIYQNAYLFFTISLCQTPPTVFIVTREPLVNENASKYQHTSFYHFSKLGRIRIHDPCTYRKDTLTRVCAENCLMLNTFLLTRARDRRSYQAKSSSFPIPPSSLRAPTATGLSRTIRARSSNDRLIARMIAITRAMTGLPRWSRELSLRMRGFNDRWRHRFNGKFWPTLNIASLFI